MVEMPEAVRRLGFDSKGWHEGRPEDRAAIITRTSLTLLVDGIMEAKNLLATLEGLQGNLANTAEELDTVVGRRPRAKDGMLDEPLTGPCWYCKVVVEPDETLVVFCPQESREDENPEARAVAHFGCHAEVMLTVVGELGVEDAFRQLYLSIRTQAFMELENRMGYVAEEVRNVINKRFTDMRSRLARDGSIL
jgi:hypothetical protein